MVRTFAESGRGDPAELGERIGMAAAFDVRAPVSLPFATARAAQRDDVRSRLIPTVG
jgi:hypothetical protein